MAIQSINPHSGEETARFEALGSAAIEEAVSNSVEAFDALRATPMSIRTSWMEKLARALESQRGSIAALMTGEMGKTLSSARAEVDKCAWLCRFYAEHGPEFLAERTIATDAEFSGVRYLPIGPVLAVMPWNFPFWQVFRFAVPALIAGNTMLLKHASNVPGCALELERLFRDAGIPDGAFRSLLISGEQASALLDDDRIRAATLTGSEKAGQSVAERAGRNLKKVVLELGGSDPFIVMPSADLEHAVEQAVKGRTINNGQSCIAAKRFIVHRDVYKKFRDAMADRFSALTVGDPMQDDTDIGPLATEKIREDLVQQVDDSVEAGAKRTLGARSLDGPGWHFEPGLLENIPDNAPAAQEELFGPVAALFEVASFDEAIKRANATRFGLGSAIFTQDRDEMERAFDEIDAGATFVNTITASDPRLPFGGVKSSGYGRELAAEGIREFCNVKTCAIGPTQG